jgi:acetyl esterase/lipase
VTGLSFLLAVVVLTVAIWAQIPAPNRTLLPLSVGAPELSAWLLILALLAVTGSAIAVRRATGRPTFRLLTMALSIIAAALPAYVLAQIPSVIGKIDAEWQRAFNGPPQQWASGAMGQWTNGVLRPHRFTWREMLFGLDLPPVQITRSVPMRTAGGVALTVDIYRPTGTAIVPAVVQLYGGGWRNGEPSDNGDVTQALAAGGFAVFAIDYRHAPAWTWPAQLEDVLVAMRWVIDHAGEYGADPTRMALLGRSAGAQLAMRASQDAAAPPIRSVVTIYGPVDLADGYRSPPSPDPIDIRLLEREFLGGTPDERPREYADASPITRAGLPHPPVLIITGSRDHVVLPRFGPMLHRKLLESGMSVFVNLPWADHGFDFVAFGPSSQIALYYMQRFLAQTLR